MEEKRLPSIPSKQKLHETKEFSDQQHLHKVISHEEVNNKEPSPTLEISLPHDCLNNSFEEKVKRILPHPLSAKNNHVTYNTNSIHKETNNMSPLSCVMKWRRILPAPQVGSSLPVSPNQSPRKLVEHLQQQSKHISLINAALLEKATAAAQKGSLENGGRSCQVVSRCLNFEESIPQAVRQFDCDHEVVAKTEDDLTCNNSPLLEKIPKLPFARKRHSSSDKEELGVCFVITSDEGIRITADSCDCKQLFTHCVHIILCYTNVVICTFFSSDLVLMTNCSGDAMFF